MKCDKCGFEFDDSYEFCPKCGAPVEHASDDNKDDAAINMHWDDSNEQSDPAITSDSAVVKPNQNKKLFVIIGAVVLLIIIIVAVSGNSKSANSVTEDYSSTESYESDDYESDDYDSDDYNYDSDTEMDIIQGSWSLLGVTNEGESTYVGDTPYSGSLDIYGDTWTMTINTTDTASYSGSLEYDYTSNGFYVYNMHASTGTGSVCMGYSLDKDYIVVSTQSYLDPDNNFFFSK